MNYSYKFRIYPNKEQENLIQRTFGCSRFVYNYFLNKRIESYTANKKTINVYACMQQLTELKHTHEYAWLNEVDCYALQCSLRNLDNAYQNFFRKNKQGIACGFPCFKKKHDGKNSYTTRQNIKVFERYIKLPKLGKVKCRVSREVKGRILKATISQSPSGKYYVSIFCTNIDIDMYKKTGAMVGLDMGLKNFAISSDGTTYENHKYIYKSEKILARLQRRLSRKSKGSKRREKARIAVAIAHEKVANQRRDFLQKLSTKIVKENDFIAMEDLPINNMVKNHKLSKSIEDASWGEFMRMIEYKATWHKKVFIKIDRFYPSSQLCSVCGYRNELTKNLSIRKWICPKCNTVHDRDINAANNILKEGIKLFHC